MTRKRLLVRVCYCYVCCCSQLKMQAYVFVVVVFCLEIRDGGMHSQAITYAFVFLPSNRIFVTFSNGALESDTNTLSTAYTHRFSFSFTHIFMQLEGKVFLQRAILFDLTREKNKNGANFCSCALKETGITIGCRLK